MSTPNSPEAHDDVSMRAIQLLAKAQSTADATVAEAQLYARDLEKTAREQYREILQRAHDTARETGGGSASADGSVVASPTPEQLQYVQTYARVAHSQMKAILGVLDDELEKLAVIAETGSVS